jgi:hypothetical protein
MLLRTSIARITPSLDRTVYLAGFASNKPAAAIHDDLWARCLLLEQGGTRVAWVVCDIIGLNLGTCRAVEARIRERLGQIDVLISCTHTHFGPDTIGLWGPTEAESGVDPQYYAWLQDALVALVCDAATLPGVPCGLKAASVRVPGVARNYREEDIVDDEATCLQFVGEAGPLATVVIYPCHPEAVTYTWTDITSDYGHGLRETLELEGGGTAFFAVGALGGMMSPTPPDQTHEQTYAMGRTIAHAALAALAAAPVQAVPRLSLARREVRFALQNPLYVMAAQAGLVPDRRVEGENIDTELSLLWLGAVALVAVPGELFPRVGLAMKDFLRQQGAAVAGVVGLTNDELGYLLRPEDFIFPQDYLNPGKQYEESMSPGPAAVPALWNALQHLAATTQQTT